MVSVLTSSVVSVERRLKPLFSQTKDHEIVFAVSPLSTQL